MENKEATWKQMLLGIIKMFATITYAKNVISGSRTYWSDFRQQHTTAFTASHFFCTMENS